MLRVLCCLCGVLGHLAPVHRCARSVCCSVCAVSWATWLLFTGVLTRCVVLCVLCPGPLGSCSPTCSLGALCCVCGVLGHLAPVRGCGRSVCCAVYAVSWATWPLFAGVPAGCVVCFVCGVLGHLAPVHRLAHSVRCVACAVSWASWLRFGRADARCVVLCMPCPGPLGSCSPVCQPGASCCVCGVLGHVAPVHWCARSVCCAVCAVFLATWLLFTGGPARLVLLRAGCLGPLGSCSAVCSLGGLCCVLRVRCPWPLKKVPTRRGPAVPLPHVTPADLLRINDCILQFPGSKIQKYRKCNPPSTLNSNQIPQIQQ